MAARLVVFQNPIVLSRNNQESLMRVFVTQKIPDNIPHTEQTFDYVTGKSYELSIPESSAGYTLLATEGGFLLQRTMAKPGSTYGRTSIGLEGKELGFHRQTVSKEGFNQKVEMIGILNENAMIPFMVDSRDGKRLVAILYNTPDSPRG